MGQITKRFSQIYPVLQEILIKHQDQLQAVKNEQEELQQKIDEKEKEKEILSKIAIFVQNILWNRAKFICFTDLLSN